MNLLLARSVYIVVIYHQTGSQISLQNVIVRDKHSILCYTPRKLDIHLIGVFRTVTDNRMHKFQLWIFVVCL